MHGTYDGHALRPSRRSVLLGAAGVIAGGSLTAPPARAEPHSAASVQESLRRATGFLGAMLDAYPDVNGSGPRLAQSYADELGLFSTAFVYDNALAICAALAADDVDLARAAGDGLLFAQQHDPAYGDGRLRQAYNVGPYVFYDGSPQPYGLAMPDGSANIAWQFGFLGTAVGDMAWPGIALVRLYRRTGDERYLRGALAIAGWITDRAESTGSLGGFAFGVTGDDRPIPNVSTEHNVDCVGFFGQLAAATGDDSWREKAGHARDFVERMWDPTGGFFYTGSNDGDTVNRSPLPLDPQTWSWLALRERRFARCLDWAAAELAATDSSDQPTSQLPEGVSVSGVTFSSASLTSTAAYNGTTVHPTGVWLEGTAQLACSMGDRSWGGHDRRLVTSLLEQVAVAQRVLGAGQHVGGRPLPPSSGVVAASSLIDTGFGFGYFPVQHVGASAWYVMAGSGVNPLR
ncbi:MAG: Tat pathway signal sequence domain protein [Actinomycetes bacterium]